MPVDRELLGKKIEYCRLQFDVTNDSLSSETGISKEKLNLYERGESEPSGDEILILADYYKCDYRYFISNDKVDSFSQTELLFRKYSDSINTNDKWAIQEVLYMSLCEQYLDEINNKKFINFLAIKEGNYLKKHGYDTAAKLREILGYQQNVVPLDIYDDFRRIGIHVFRRKLENQKISGIFINHPKSGKCVIVNYNEDVFRQRFTVAHEAAHALFDCDDEVILSFVHSESSLKETRANTFASSYLIPPDITKQYFTNAGYSLERALGYALKLKTNPIVLAIALKEHKIINQRQYDELSAQKFDNEQKIDPEIAGGLSPSNLERKRYLLEKGLNSAYVIKCINAYQNGNITLARMAEMLLINDEEVTEIMEVFRLSADYGN